MARLAELGANIVEIDIEPFYEAARLLYEGPWVAERYLTVKDLIASAPEIAASGDAADHCSPARTAPRPMHSPRSISSRRCGACAITHSATIDALVLPTAPTIYTVEQVLADPIGLNSRLGTYTNFVNLLDLCGLAVPAVDAAGRHAVRHHAARARG